MKDQYFGDFGDYQKISLLEKLNKSGLKIITYWMKTPDDGGTDGKHITYLNKPNIWRVYEPEIFDFLANKINSSHRHLSHIEKCKYCKGILFINENIENVKVREKVLEEICSNKIADLVFFDPNNGIEVASTNKKNIHNYVTWNEILQTFNSGKSVLIYQHFSRSNRDTFIKSKVNEIKKKINAPVITLRVKYSVYIFIIQKNHTIKIQKSIADFSSKWKEWSMLGKY